MLFNRVSCLINGGVIALVASCTQTARFEQAHDGEAARDGRLNGDSALTSQQVDAETGDAEDEDPAVNCGGFTVPNPPNSGLPHPASYTANSDGTVTDDVTRLVWEGAVNAPPYSQYDALAYCARRGAGWRLPSLFELYSLVDFTIAAPGPTINQTAFPGAPTDHSYWTSSPVAGSSGLFWNVAFYIGYTDHYVALNTNRVRCVRATVKCLNRRYQVHPQSIVHDVATGLDWQQSPPDSTYYAWAEAKAYCAAQGDNWRLPSLPELVSLVDLAQAPPIAMIDQVAFPNARADRPYWTSSPVAGLGNNAWIVRFDHGNTYNSYVSNALRVRCVR